MSDQFSLPDRYAPGDTAVMPFVMSAAELTECCRTVVVYYSNNVWYRCHTGFDVERTSLENVVYRMAVQQGGFAEIEDVCNHPSYKFIAFKMTPPILRYISAMPLLLPPGITTGAIIACDFRRRP